MPQLGLLFGSEIGFEESDCKIYLFKWTSPGIFIIYFRAFKKCKFENSLLWKISSLVFVDESHLLYYLVSRYYVTFPFSFFFFPYFFSLCLSAYQSGCLFKLFYVYFLSYFDLQFNFFLDIYFFLFTRLCLFFDLFSVYAFASCLSSFLLAWVEAKEWLRTTSHSHHSPHITIFKRWSLKEREMPSSQKSKCKLH